MIHDTKTFIIEIVLFRSSLNINTYPTNGNLILHFYKQVLFFMLFTNVIIKPYKVILIRLDITRYFYSLIINKDSV